jgi:hypothetical protein
MRPERASWFNEAFTPWCRSAIRSNQIDPDELRARVPDGWRMGGHAHSARGPFAFSLLGPASEIVTVTAFRWNEVRDAFDRLFAQSEQAHAARMHLIGEIAHG